MATYSIDADIEARYGVDNVAKWADLNNNLDAAEIAARKLWARTQAQSDIDDALRGGPYTVPFAATYPPAIVDLEATLAGVLLYESRGVQDFDPETGRPQHRLHYQRSRVEKKLKQIRSGAVRLDVATVATAHPQVVSEDVTTLLAKRRHAELEQKAFPDAIGNGSQDESTRFFGA